MVPRTCRECQAQISKSAPNCPQCGTMQPFFTVWGGHVVNAFVILVAIAIIVGIFAGSN